MIRRRWRLRTRYAEELSLLGTPGRRFWTALLILVLVLVPLTAPPHWLSVLNLTAIAVIGAVALNLLTGYAGQISLGHAGFVAVGAFVTAILIEHFHAPFWLTILSSALAGAIVGVLVGVPALRLKGLYLAVSTLAAYFVIIAAAGYYQSNVRYNAGFLLPKPSLGPLVLDSEFKWYAFLVVAAGLATLAGLNLARSAIGRAWIAIRDRDVAAAVIGVNVAAYKILAFVISTAMTSVAGCLLAYYNGVVSHETFSILMTIEFLAMIIIGGMGTIGGSVCGAVFVSVVPYAIDRAMEGLAIGAGTGGQEFAVRAGVFGVLMLAFLLLEPRGLVGLWERARAYFALWPFRYRPLSS